MQYCTADAGLHRNMSLFGDTSIIGSPSARISMSQKYDTRFNPADLMPKYRSRMICSRDAMRNAVGYAVWL
jgi:hypothetical protein